MVPFLAGLERSLLTFFRGRRVLAHHVTSRQRGISVAVGAKRTRLLTDAEPTHREHETLLSPDDIARHVKTLLGHNVTMLTLTILVGQGTTTSQQR
jgi:hypothetical protein